MQHPQWPELLRGHLPPRAQGTVARVQLIQALKKRNPLGLSEGGWLPRLAVMVLWSSVTKARVWHCPNSAECHLRTEAALSWGGAGCAFNVSPGL